MADITLRTQKGFGWHRQLPDHRDRVFTFAPVALPAAASLDPALMPPVFDQGSAGSCTGASTSRAVMYLEALEGQPRMDQSALFAYYNARLLEGNAGSDAGASIRDAVKGIMEYGLCAESLWPYSLSKLTKKPSAQAYSDAKYSVLTSYELIDGNSDPVIAAKTALNSKWPVEFGFSVYQSFMTPLVASTGIVPMPDPTEELIGGHAVWSWQYSDSRQAFLVRNSWGSNWGVSGDFWLPYAYFGDDNLASDRWVLKNVS